ncbi:uncharacterized protein LOC143194877 [Rhynchophorus ferrugineus]
MGNVWPKKKNTFQVEFIIDDTRVITVLDDRTEGVCIPEGEYFLIPDVKYVDENNVGHFAYNVNSKEFDKCYLAKAGMLSNRLPMYAAKLSDEAIEFAVPHSKKGIKFFRCISPVSTITLDSSIIDYAFPRY